MTANLATAKSSNAAKLFVRERTMATARCAPRVRSPTPAGIRLSIAQGITRLCVDGILVGINSAAAKGVLHLMLCIHFFMGAPMKSHAIATTTLVAILSSTASIAAERSEGGPRVKAGPVAPLAAIDTSTEAKFVRIKACRLVNTQLAGGKLAAGATRAFKATGDLTLAGQGGAETGCGIPEAATAISASFIAVAAEGKGLLLAGPDNAPLAATSTFLGYSSQFDAAARGILIIETTNGAFDFKVKNASPAKTHLIVDTQGYFIKPIFAHIQSNGTLLQSSRVVSSVRDSIGRYTITFDRDVTGCVANAQASGGQQSDIIIVSGGTPQSLTVDIEEPSPNPNVQKDDRVFLLVTC